MFRITLPGGLRHGVMAAFHLAAFVVLAKFVHDRALADFDVRAIKLIQSYSNIWLDRISVAFTIIGSGEATSVISLFMAAGLWMSGRPRAAFWFLAFFGASVAIELWGKFNIAQPKVFPEFRRGLRLPVPVFSPYTPYAFPSGHATRTIYLGGFVYHFLGMLQRFNLSAFAAGSLSSSLPPWCAPLVRFAGWAIGFDRRKNAILGASKVALAIFMALMLVSRAYEGGHWPCDVIGGFFLGNFLLNMALRKL